MYVLYILLCKGGSLYTGITTDIENRFRLHKSGKGAKYTRSRKPVRVVYTENCASRSSALTREAEIKKFRREQKLELIASSGSSV